MGGRGAGLWVCRGTVHHGGGAAVRDLRAGARPRAATPSAAGDQGRRRICVASSAAASGVCDAIHLQHGFLPVAGGVRALCGASSRTVGDRCRRHAVTPPRLLGRVSAINIMSYGARPLGSALGAIVGGFYGAEVCLYLAAAIFSVQALVILMSPAVALAQQPEMIGDGPRGAAGL